jgi:hypothetical protein
VHDTFRDVEPIDLWSQLIPIGTSDQNSLLIDPLSSFEIAWSATRMNDSLAASCAFTVFLVLVDVRSFDWRRAGRRDFGSLVSFAG